MRRSRIFSTKLFFSFLIPRTPSAWSTFFLDNFPEHQELFHTHKRVRYNRKSLQYYFKMLQQNFAISGILLHSRLRQNKYVDFCLGKARAHTCMKNIIICFGININYFNIVSNLPFFFFSFLDSFPPVLNIFKTGETRYVLRHNYIFMYSMHLFNINKCIIQWV